MLLVLSLDNFNVGFVREIEATTLERQNDTIIKKNLIQMFHNRDPNMGKFDIFVKIAQLHILSSHFEHFCRGA